MKDNELNIFSIGKPEQLAWEENQGYITENYKSYAKIKIMFPYSANILILVIPHKRI